MKLYFLFLNNCCHQFFTTTWTTSSPLALLNNRYNHLYRLRHRPGYQNNYILRHRRRHRRRLHLHPHQAPMLLALPMICLLFTNLIPCLLLKEHDPKHSSAVLLNSSVSEEVTTAAPPHLPQLLNQHPSHHHAQAQLPLENGEGRPSSQ